MPKILINEIDLTSPGTPGDYSNYSVLIAGLMGRTPVLTKDADSDMVNQVDNPRTADKIQPDINGVYEFSSASDFKETVGLCSPKVVTGSSGYYHYGNQMAYELLNLGYSIIYAPIKNVFELTDAKFWEKFKDKANYDFRFITHGLLGSTETKDVFNKKQDLIEIEKAIKELDRIKSYVESLELAETEEAARLDAEYENSCANFEGFVYEEDKRYESYTEARAGLTTRKAVLSAEINALSVGLVNTETINSVNRQIANLAMYHTEHANPGRGDCIALVELDEKTYNSAIENPEIAIIDAMDKMSLDSYNGKYCALTVPSVCYKATFGEDKDKVYKENKKFPGAFHYLACFKRSLGAGFAEWYAAAGYTRGVSDYVIDRTTVNLGEIAINALEPRNLDNDQNTKQPKFACNVIANFRGSYYLWGNRTAHPLEAEASGGDLVASHFLNIRQLSTTIKKQLYVSCRRFTFDPNSDTLWFNFVNAIRPTLDRMKADQGIRDYRILKVKEDNPKKATLKAIIRIIPIEAVEDFDITISLEDSFGETAATAVD